MTVDPFNRAKHHAAVLIGSLVLAGVLWASGYAVSRIVAAVPWFLLFLVLIIGPVTKIRPSIMQRYGENFPLNWQSELGIWFVVWSLVHVFGVFRAFGWEITGFLVGMSAWTFGALVAVGIAIMLAITSNTKAFQFMGPKAWKWHQSHGTYVMFWLLVVHIYDQTFVGTVPTDDMLQLLYVLTTVIVVGLHGAAFLTVVSYYRSHGEYPSWVS